MSLSFLGRLLQHREPVACIEENPIIERLRQGAIYDNKEELNIAIGLWNLESRAEYIIEK